MNPAFWLTYIGRSFRRGGRRTFFAVLCVALGVGAVVALQLAAINVRASLTSDVRASNGGDISLVSQTSPLSSSDLAIFKQLQRTHRISQWTAVASIHATAVGTSHLLVPFEADAVSAPPYPLGGQPTFVTPSNGHVAPLLTGPGSALLTSVLADELGAHVGDRFEVNGIGGSGLQITVTGIVAETSFEHSAVMTIERRDAAGLGNGPTQYTAVYVDVPPASAPAVTALLRNRFPTATIQTVQEALRSDEQQVHDFTQFTLLIGLLALAIAGIGILNAMQSLLAWRRLEIAMLKALGFGQPSLYLLFGGEAVCIGLAGGIAGSGLGALLGEVITNTLASSAALQVQFQLDPGTLVAGVILGIGTTLVFAVLPIARAAGLRPLEMLRPGSEGLGGRLPQTLGLLVLVGLLFAALAAAIIGDPILAVQFAIGGFLAAGLLAALFSAAVAALSRLEAPNSRVLGIVLLLVLVTLTVLTIQRFPPLAAIAGLATILWGGSVLLPARMLFPLLIALRSLGRRRARTSVTLVAFLVGILAMSLTLTVALSLQHQLSAALAATRAANLVAIASEGDRGTILRASQRLPDIRKRSAVTIATTRPLAVDGRSLARIIGPAPSSGDPEDRQVRLLDGITGYNLRQGSRPIDTQIVDGRGLIFSDTGSNHVIVSARLQGPPMKLHPGSRIRLTASGSGKMRTVTVIGFYTHPHGFRARGFTAFFTPPVYGDHSLALSLAGSDAQTVASFTVDATNLAADSTALQRAVPSALVLNVHDLTAVVQRILSDLLNVLIVITALALGAGLGVVGNGVTLAMLERYREIAIYKAIGFQPGNVLGFVLLENALTGVIAGAFSVLLVAVGLAALSHFALQTAIGFDPLLAVLVLIVASLLAVVIAYFSARRPIDVRPLEALRNE